MGYLRIATHASIFARPLSASEAMRNIEALISRPHARLLSEEDGFCEIYRKVAGEAAVRGNLVPVAHLAAILLQHGVSLLYTLDRDFHRFRFLDVRDPLAG